MPVLPAFLDAYPVAREAALLAISAHAGQRRESDHAPFVLHPLEVASLLANRGFDDEVVAAGVLHDLIEDTGVTLEDLQAQFGARVTRLVGAVTEDATITEWSARKAALRDQIATAPQPAQAIFAADKIVKVRELRAELSRSQAPMPPPLAQRLEHYALSLQRLEHSRATPELVAQLRFELWALEHLPPRVGV